VVTPSGTIFRLKGSILTMSFLDCNGILIPGKRIFPHLRVSSRSDANSQVAFLLIRSQGPMNHGKMNQGNSRKQVSFFPLDFLFGPNDFSS